MTEFGRILSFLIYPSPMNIILSSLSFFITFLFAMHVLSESRHAKATKDHVSYMIYGLTFVISYFSMLISAVWFIAVFVMLIF